MKLPRLPLLSEIERRLPIIIPEGTPHRDKSTRATAARTIFVLLYTGAIEGGDQWLRPDQVTRMTDEQSQKSKDAERIAWVKRSMQRSKGDIAGRWYAGNTRESIRDDTIRGGLIPIGAIVDRQIATTSSKGRYALQAEFAKLFNPILDEASLLAKSEAWREKHLQAGALARIAIVRKGAAASGEYVLVTYPNQETRRLTPGPSSEITKSVVEVFAIRFLENPAVIFLSESGNKVISRDDELAKSIGLNIQVDKNLPDIVLVDLEPRHPLLVFVEVVATDGPVNETRKAALLALAEKAGFPGNHVAFVTAFLDRDSSPFKRTVPELAWGSYAWFASEPEKLVVFSEAPTRIAGYTVS